MAMEFKLTVNMRKSGEMTFELARWPDEKALTSLVAKIKHVLDEKHEEVDVIDDANDDDTIPGEDELEEVDGNDLDDIPYPDDSEPTPEAEAQKAEDPDNMLAIDLNTELMDQKHKQVSDFLDYYLGPLAGYACPKFRYQCTEICERYSNWARVNNKLALSRQTVLFHLGSVIRERGWSTVKRQRRFATDSGDERAEMWIFVNIMKDEVSLPETSYTSSVRAFLLAMLEHEDRLVGRGVAELYDRYQEWCKVTGRNDALQKQRAFQTKLWQVGKELGLVKRTVAHYKHSCRDYREIIFYKPKSKDNEQQENEQ